MTTHTDLDLARLKGMYEEADTAWKRDDYDPQDPLAEVRGQVEWFLPVEAAECYKALYNTFPALLTRLEATERERDRLREFVQAFHDNRVAEFLQKHGVNLARFDGLAPEILTRAMEFEAIDIMLHWDERQKAHEWYDRTFPDDKQQPADHE